jgi:hypothetical protein
MIGKEKERSYDDNDLIKFSSLVINTLKTKDIPKIWTVLNTFGNGFKRWIEIDKNKMIEKMIVSFYYHKEHINKILSLELNKKMSTEERKLIIESLEKECSDIKKTIKIIDKNFDINYLENNYTSLYKNIIEGWEKMRNSITNNMIIGYYNILYDDIKSGNNMLIFNEIKQIEKRLLVIIPPKRKENFSSNFTSENILNLLIENDFTKELIDFIDMIIDIILMLDAPENDIINNKWKLSIKEFVKQDYNKNFPKILIEINQHIDIIYNSISNIK